MLRNDKKFEEPQRRIIRLVYTAAYLEGRILSGLKLNETDADRLERLTQFFAVDSETDQRRHRRFDTALPVVLKVNGRFAPALALDISAGGFLLSTSQPLAAGTHIQVKISDTEADYHFPCVVRRCTQKDGKHSVAVSIASLPLEIRRGPTPKAPKTHWATSFAAC